MSRNYTKIAPTVLAGIVFLIGAAAAAQNTSFPEDLTIRRQGNTGSKQYLVYVSGSDPNLLKRVKTVVPDAFNSRLSSGQRIVQIGRYSSLDMAQKRIEQLQQSGLSAQVATVPSKVSTYNPPPIATPIPVPTQTEIPITLPGVPRSPGSSSLPPTNAGTLIPIPTEVVPLPPPPSVAIEVPPATAPNVKNRYFVIIPSTVDAVLDKARNIVPTARLTSSDRGTYIEVQGYPDRPSAETLNATLRSQGLDSRVIYF